MRIFSYLHSLIRNYTNIKFLEIFLPTLIIGPTLLLKFVDWRKMQKCTIVFHTSFQEIFITSGITVKVSDNLMRNGHSWKAFYFFPKEILNINYPQMIIIFSCQKILLPTLLLPPTLLLNLINNFLPTLLFRPTLLLIYSKISFLHFYLGLHLYSEL